MKTRENVSYVSNVYVSTIQLKHKKELHLVSFTQQLLNPIKILK